ncbi:histidine kinase N-terminal 7TM domain-containing protein [Halovenus sp. HT40]|uniref:histidine kinase N-terminal 7TM domain-containing protein n=1 Tax=Halovenus sp. HT40 TaxID=3126691 RepID=UPI00300F11D8
MELQYTPYTIPLIAALVLAVAGTVITWYQRDSAVETWSVGLQLSVLLWILFNLLMISTTSRRWILLWYRLFFPCIGLVIVAMMGFTFQFTGRGEQLTRRRLGLLFAFPAGILLVSLTNPIHELLLVDPTIDTSGSFAVLDVGFGPAVYVILLLAHGLIAVYVSLLVLQVLRSRNVYRKLSFVLLAMVLVMTAATIPKVMGVSPFPYWIFFAMAYLVVGLGTLVTTTSITAARMVPVDRILAAISSRTGDVVPLARNVIVQEVDNGILVLDTDGRVVDINRTAKTMLGIERPVGRLLSEITDEDLARGGEELSPILWGDAPLREVRDQIWVQTGRGERCYDVRITELTDGSGAPAGFVVLLHDITEQKESEQQLERQRNELRTQKQQLEHQNERLDQFASIVSHDLRNPLNVAQGNVELPYSRADDNAETVDVDLDRLETIHSAHERMEDIINDALALAREGKAITETESVTLNAVAEEAWSNVETGAATLELNADGTLEADRDRLLTVFENLIRNAVEHGTQEGEPLTLRVGLLDDSRGFYIEDDGIGIPAEEHDEVFEHGHTTSADGTGLGLSIVRDIIRGHGWTITASDSDDGARFEVAEVSVHPTDTPETTGSED